MRQVAWEQPFDGAEIIALDEHVDSAAEMSFKSGRDR
jgi:hypothetical protein